MTTNVKLREAYEAESKHAAFFTGGNVEWHKDTLFCQTASQVSLLNVEEGTVTLHIGEEPSEDADFIQTFTTDNIHLVSSHKSGLLKLWNLQGQLVKMWKYIHKGPIARLTLKDNILASGGADSSVRIWDLDHQSCILNLKGCQGVVNVVEIHKELNLVFASGDDGKVLSFELDKGAIAMEYSGHYSKVTSLVFAKEHLVTCGRDKVIILWKMNKAKVLRTIPLYEVIESIALLPEKFHIDAFKSDPENIYVASGGESGLVRVWDVTNATEIYTQSNSLVNKAGEGELAITKLLHQNKKIAVITADHNIILHNLKMFLVLKQFVGFSDEILDVVYVGKDSNFIAVATNSCDIKFYDSTMNCQLLKGHSDIVLALHTSLHNPNLMISAGKDNKMRLWNFNGSGMDLIGVGLRHTGSVGTAAFCNTSLEFFVSGSQDNCIKTWEVPQNLQPGGEAQILTCKKTEVAHQKDINCVAVSPNDKIIASASQDKTVKLWTDELTFVGTLRGHKRGVWCVRFSPVDQVVLTSSADCTVKLWSVAELNCLKTLEGHESSVLRAEFITNGMQILTAGSDGLIKLFSVKTSECSGTFEQHSGRIWTMAVKKDESQLITGGSDSVLIKWKDVSEERQLQRIQEKENEVLQQQQLSNYIQNDELLKALKLALKLDRPMQVLKIVQGIIRKGETNGLADTVKALRNDQKEVLLKCSANWNMNSKYCEPAQLVVNVLLDELQGGEFRPVGFNEILEGLLPYTERHFKRLTQVLQDLQFIEYTVNCMQPHIKGD